MLFCDCELQFLKGSIAHSTNIILYNQSYYCISEVIDEGRYILASVHHTRDIQDSTTTTPIATILNIYGRASLPSYRSALYTELLGILIVPGNNYKHIIPYLHHGDFNYYQFKDRRLDGTLACAPKEWTDHELLGISFQYQDSNGRGPGSWKANPSFLARNQQFRTALAKFLHEHEEHQFTLIKTFTTPQQQWDWVKAEDKLFIRKFQLEDLNWRKKQQHKLLSKQNKMMRQKKNRGLPVCSPTPLEDSSVSFTPLIEQFRLHDGRSIANVPASAKTFRLAVLSSVFPPR